MENFSNPILHRIEKPEKNNKSALLSIGLIILGVISGFILSKNFNRSSTTPNNSSGNTDVQGKKVVGSQDNKVFPDQAEGTLESGGINGEGTHKLIRPGGDNQTVYLTSSVLSLTEFEGKKVRVWGETRAGNKAGWLMDVGKVEILQ